MPFENFEILTESLPNIKDIQYESLEKNYLKVTVIAASIFWLIAIIALLVFYFLNDFEYPDYINYIGFSVIFLIILFSYYVSIQAFFKKAYVLREKDIVYKSGLFWKSLISIPFNRVQHCEVKQGPIERMFDLGQLSVFTAGGSQSDLHISGLSFEKANKLKQYILIQTSQDEEE